LSKENGRPSAAILIKQRPGTNASEVIKNIKSRMEQLKASFPPGMTYTVSYDVSAFLDASVHEVLKTLAEAFILVALVVFIFLQDIRSTLIPAIAVPVSLVGTLFFMQLFGFSLNLITLFALVLSIGIVVDNAIVVIEAVHAKMEDPGVSARRGYQGGHERDQRGHHCYNAGNVCRFFTGIIYGWSHRCFLPSVFFNHGYRYCFIGHCSTYTYTSFMCIAVKK
jgi:multidrug efflux pump subunit AcrB